MHLSLFISNLFFVISLPVFRSEISEDAKTCIGQERKKPYLIFASLAAGDSGTTKRTWMGSLDGRWGWATAELSPLLEEEAGWSAEEEVVEVEEALLKLLALLPAPPTMEKPQLARSRRWRITVLGYCKLKMR